MLFPRGITFDDVLLVPGYNGIRSRQAVSTEVTFGGPEKPIALGIPIISANMDTITGGAMATAMAKLGEIRRACEAGNLPQARNHPDVIRALTEAGFRPDIARALVEAGADPLGVRRRLLRGGAGPLQPGPHLAAHRRQRGRQGGGVLGSAPPGGGRGSRGRRPGRGRRSASRW